MEFSFEFDWIQFVQMLSGFLHLSKMVNILVDLVEELFPPSGSPPDPVQACLNPYGQTSGVVVCSNGQIIELHLQNLNLTGAFDLSPLPVSLQYLDISQNTISSIVNGIWNMNPTLNRTMVMRDNQTPVTLADRLYSSFSKIIITNSQAVAVFPSTIPNLLTYLDLHQNQIYGSLNENLNQLTYLDVSRNLLSRSFPANLLGYHISHFDISHNSISGQISIPSTITEFIVNDNSLNGNIDFSSIMAPKAILIQNNQFTLISISNTNNLTECDLSNNAFGIPLPYQVTQYGFVCNLNSISTTTTVQQLKNPQTRILTNPKLTTIQNFLETTKNQIYQQTLIGSAIPDVEIDNRQTTMGVPEMTRAHLNGNATSAVMVALTTSVVKLNNGNLGSNTGTTGGLGSDLTWDQILEQQVDWDQTH